MKKYVLILFMMIGMAVSASAQIQYYRTTAFAQATVYNGRYYWGDWQRSDMTITINLNTDVVVVYSPTTQVYNVITSGDSYTDSSGGQNVKFRVVDQDGDRGWIRLRIERNGNSQIYVDFNNVAWVYNVVRTR